MLVNSIKWLSQISPQHVKNVVFGLHFHVARMQSCRIQQVSLSTAGLNWRLLCRASRQLKYFCLRQGHLTVIDQRLHGEKLFPSSTIIQTCHGYHNLATRNLPNDTSISSSHGNHITKQGVHQSIIDKDGYTLIYELKKSKYRQVQFVSFFTYFLAAYWVYLSPDVLVSAFEHDTLNSKSALDLLGLLLSTFILPSACQYVRSQVVLKAYHNEVTDAYKLITLKATLRQRVEDVWRQEIKRVIWSEKRKSDRPVQARFQVNNRKYIMYAPYFKLPADYNHMMGFTSKTK